VNVLDDGDTRNAHMLTIWGRKTSSNVQALMWCAGELGLAYQRHDVGHIYGGLGTPEFRSLNPNGTIPVLRDGDGPPLWETGAILRYLCNRYGTDPFWPSELKQRTEVDMWAEWAKLNVTLGFTMPIFWRVVRTVPAAIDWSAVRTATAALSQHFDIAEARIARSNFLCGDHLTLADIQFGHVLYRYHDIPIERPDHPALRAYYARLTERAAFREHVMVSYDALRVS
jgi:glutathione S-transferase